MAEKIASASVRPTNSLDLLSFKEMQGVTNTDAEVFQLFRQCALAVLNTGNDNDDVAELTDQFHDFDIRIEPQPRGIKLKVKQAPACAFVDGKMIAGIQAHLFSALRDIVYTHHKASLSGRFDLDTSEGITDAVFRILRNANIVKPGVLPNLVVCWGGHSISPAEYQYSKEVGYHLGLRGLNIATGCGIGAMKGPMKGAVVGHGKQQIRDGRYIGITEPGIIASESPNPTVSELVILPDIEKRLEAFVRLAHGIIVFPGGAGTAEEVLYLLGVLMHPDNSSIDIPLVFAAPETSGDYFTALDQFLVATIGEQVRRYYTIVEGSPAEVARKILHGTERVHRYRRRHQESYAYNWQLTIPLEFQRPFHPSHANMSALQLDKSLPAHDLAAELRRAFSGIVAGNVKASGVAAIKQHGPYQLNGDPQLMQSLDQLLQGFVAQGRMKLKGDYQPCYEITVT